VLEKTRAATQKTSRKRKKSIKNVHGPLNHSVFSTQLPKFGTGKSPTSNMLLRNADKRNYATYNCV